MVSLIRSLSMNLAGCLYLLSVTSSAFRIPPSRPLTPNSYLNKYSNNIEANESFHSVSSTTALHGKLWKRLQIEEDDPADGTSWYLINCIAGVEFDLLNQCREVCKHFSTKDVEKFVVPTERHLRSHGDKKKVVDVKVRYPGYVFCKIRLCEDVYETLQELEYARSWMGTVNRKGHKKLPPAPMPLGPEEVAKFKGLEEEQEVFEDMFGGDYTGRADHGADLLSQYAGYDVGQMVKILKGRFEGEDGTIRRLKNGQLMVRMFTYGQTYDEWFDPDAIRPLTDLEVMRGLSGPTTPINQDQFDVSIGKKDPSILEGPMDGDSNMIGSGDGASLRSGLLQSAGAGGPGRNRREDRIARGETGNRDLFGRSAEDIKREEQNWLAYREQQRAGGSSSLGGTNAGQPEPVKKKKEGPKKGEDTWGIVERSSWDGGEYGFEADSEEEERERKRRTAELYKDRVPRDRRGRDGRESFDQRQSFRGEVGNRREQNSMERRSVVGQSRDRDRNDNDWSSFSSSSGENTNKEEDFFDSLMSQLSNDLRDDSSENDSRVRGSRRHDNAGPITAKAAVKSSTGAEDSFFENLMAELGGALDKSESYSSRTSKSEKQIDDDDFFSSLEAELSQSLGGVFHPENESEREEDVDDFFANLESEMSKVGGGSSGTGVERNVADDFFGSSREDNDADDFFSSLIDDLAQEMSNEETEPGVITSNKAASSNLSSFTVPELKDLLRSKGLKVGGTKAELIDRLQSAS